MSSAAKPMLGRRSEAILDAVREQIRSGVLRRGQRLPAEAELCVRHSASRTSVRRALAHLRAEGLIRTRQGAGAFVCGRPRRPAALRTVSMMFPFSGELLTRIQDYALGQGLLTCVFSQRRQHWDPAIEKAFLELVLQEHHLGLLAFCSPTPPTNEDALRRLARAGIRVVHVEHYRRTLPAQGYLLPDYRRAGQLAVRHLRRGGYGRILYAGTSLEAPYSQLLREGVAAALGGRTQDCDCLAVPPMAQEHPAFGAQVAALVQTAGSAGFACESSGIAQLLKQVLERHGLSVPRDAGVVGPELVGPPAKTEGVDLLTFEREAILRRAVDAVVTGTDVHELVPARIVERGTVRDAEARRR